MKSKLSKSLLLTTGIVALSSTIIILGLKATKSFTPDSSKSSTRYV